MSEELEKAKSENDSLGGTVECRVLGLPVGVGEPIFDSVESVISHGIFSIPAVKGIEFGGGFGLSSKRGSEANDEFAIEGGRIVTQSNNSGGILGGITNGMPIVLRVAFKPTPSIGKKQRSVDISTMKKKEIRVEGRHDPCIAVRAVPVVEAMVATCLADLMIRVHKIGRVEGKI
jgi:chorismate synthase